MSARHVPARFRNGDYLVTSDSVLQTVICRLGLFPLYVRRDYDSAAVV